MSSIYDNIIVSSNIDYFSNNSNKNFNLNVNNLDDSEDLTTQLKVNAALIFLLLVIEI